MLQLGSLGGRASSDYDNVVANGSPTNGERLTSSPAQTSGHILHKPQEFQQGSAPFPPERRAGTLVHWRAAQPPQQPATNGVNQLEEDEDDDEYRPFTPPPPRERLSYTRHQLEMLNGIYQEVRYPNSTQKQLIAKRIGITREQVKIWFQNRRRKDVVTKVGKGKAPSKEDNSFSGSENTNPTSPLDTNEHNTWSEADTDINSSNGGSEQAENYETDLMSDTARIGNIDYSEPDVDNHIKHEISNGGSSNNNNASKEVPAKIASPAITKPATPSSPSAQFVSPTILRGMIAELNKFDNEYLKLKKNKKKKNKSKFSRHPTPSSRARKSERLFQQYDMVAPPNQVISTAFLNTSVNKFKHAVDTSAFQSPRENRMPAASNDSRLWEGFSLNPSVPGMTENPDFVQQKAPSDLMHASYTSTLSVSAPSSQSQFSNFLSGRDRVSLSHSSLPNTQSHLYDNLPILSDLLGNYSSHPPSASIAAAVAAAAAQRQQEHSILSCVSSGQSQTGTNLPGVYFHLPGDSNSNISGDSSKSMTSDICFPRPSALPHHPHHQASTLAMNRVFPFPLVAEPPRMLSSRQGDTFLHHSQWSPSAPPIISQTSSHSTALGIHRNRSTSPAHITKDQYRPLMISSLTNPYYPAPATAYSLTSSGLPSQSSPWGMQPPTDNTNFSQTQL